MADNGDRKPSIQHGGEWFVHGGEQGELESTTKASLRHVLDTAAALGTEYRQPLEYKARVEKAGNNHFPFSSHDNRHNICNAVEYFDSGMGVRKVDPDKLAQKSHNFLEWAADPGESSKRDLLTVYQTSFVADLSPGNEDCPARRYPKHHTPKQCPAQKKCCCHEPAADEDRALQPYKPS